MAICQDKHNIGIACLELSTGRFTLNQLESLNDLYAELIRLTPAEILLAEDLKLPSDWQLPKILIHRRAIWDFDYQLCHQVLCTHFRTKDLSAFACQELTCGISAAGCLLAYVKNNQNRDGRTAVAALYI
jgi:DNA mismatch repair protein MutS